MALHSKSPSPRSDRTSLLYLYSAAFSPLWANPRSKSWTFGTLPARWGDRVTSFSPSSLPVEVTLQFITAICSVSGITRPPRLHVDPMFFKFFQPRPSIPFLDGRGSSPVKNPPDTPTLGAVPQSPIYLSGKFTKPFFKNLHTINK